VVVAGKGNNGADGRSAARRLARRGVRATVLDAADLPSTLPRADLVIDAAYGTGFRGIFDVPALADPATPVLAVDIPSGVDGLTGVAAGPVLRAVRTVTFAAWKPGLLLGDGPELAGEVQLIDLGLDTARARAHRVVDADVARWLPDRPRSAHKWRSAVWLVAGSPGMTGAARLAAGGAQRGGAGYVRVSVPGAGHDVDAPTEAVVVPVPADGWAAEVLDGEARFGALAVGPGLGRGPAVEAGVRQMVARSSRPIVVDGDALRELGREAGWAIGSRVEGAGPVVLTPHDGELEALAGHPPGADRFAEVRDLARQTGAVVLLKGPTTLVAAPDGRVLAVDAGDARLATAGTGDVLTGLVAALLAQGIPALEAAASAALLHGRAGDLAWPRGLVAGDLVDHLPAALIAVAGGSRATFHPRL
jgi:NAD(P)H-hydrate epimerase